MEFIDKIGNRIKMIRLHAGFKQKDLAKELVIQAPLLSLYEQGKREPSLNFLKKFCDFFNISVSQFFAFVEESNLNNNKIYEDLNPLIKDLNKVLSSLEKINLSKIKRNTLA